MAVEDQVLQIVPVDWHMAVEVMAEVADVVLVMISSTALVAKVYRTEVCTDRRRLGVAVMEHQAAEKVAELSMLKSKDCR